MTVGSEPPVTEASNRCIWCRGQLKCDGTRAETRFRLLAKRTSLFKSAGASVQSTTGSRGVRISGSNAGYTMFRGSVKSTGYPLHSPVSPSLSLPYVTACHLISTGLYQKGSATTFCPLCSCICFVWRSEDTVIAYFTVQNSVTGFYNGYEVCFLRGMKWIFKYSSC